MRYVKCLDISSVPEPTAQDVPRIIWVTTGELYADLQIAGEPLRIKISDILTRQALPDNPRTTAIYRHNDQYKYFAQDEWHTIATADDLKDPNRNLSVADLFNAVFDSTTGIAKLNENVEDLVELLSGDGGVVARLTAAETELTNLGDVTNTISTTVTTHSEDINEIDDRVSVIEQSLDGLVDRMEKI